MEREEMLQLLTPCGYCCLSCPIYVESTCTDEMALQKDAVRSNLPIEKVRGMCSGCRPKQGRPHGDVLCETFDCCINKKGLDFCYECEDFPCLKLAPISAGAEIRRHNAKVYNLLMLKKLGMEEYIKQSPDILARWVRGKTPVFGGDVSLIDI